MSFDPTDITFKDWLRDMLKVTPVVITFTKSDGTQRVMNCTLQEGVIVPYQKKTEREKAHNPETLAVWDLDKGEWRSFRYASITAVNASI